MTVHRLLDHDGGAGLALRPRRRGGVGGFGLIKPNILSKFNIKDESTWLVVGHGADVELTCVLNLGLNSLAFGLRVDFLTCLQKDGEKVLV